MCMRVKPWEPPSRRSSESYWRASSWNLHPNGVHMFGFISNVSLTDHSWMRLLPRKQSRPDSVLMRPQTSEGGCNVL